MELTSIESAVMAWFARHTDRAGLREAIGRAVPVKRTSSRSGVFVVFDDPAMPLDPDQRREANPSAGPFIEAPSLPNGADSVLYVNEECQPDALEIFTYGDDWHDEIEAFKLIPPTPVQ